MDKEIILRCPLRESITLNCLRVIKVKDGKESNPPFWYSPEEGIAKMMKHIQDSHSLRDFKTFFEDNLASQIMEESK